MIWIYDLLLLLGASVWLGTRDLYLGVLIFTVGLFFSFQTRRTRLLLGGSRKPRPMKSRIMGAMFGVLVVALAFAMTLGPSDAVPALELGEAGEASLAIVAAVGALSAVLVISLTTEKRTR